MPWSYLAVGADTGEIATHVLTEGHADDAAQVLGLLGQVERVIPSVAADGAYDGEPTYAVAAARHRPPPPDVIVPPRASAVPSSDGMLPYLGMLAGAAKAIQSLQTCHPARIDGPYRLEMDLNTVAIADLAAIIPAAERLGPRTVAFAAVIMSDVLGWINTVSVLSMSLR